MKKKIVGIFVCMLLIVVVFPVATSTVENKSNCTDNDVYTLINIPFINRFDLSSKKYETIQKNAYKDISLNRGWYWMAPYPNYAPHTPGGMPDFSLKQNNWKAIFDGGNGICESNAGGDDVQIIPNGASVPPGSALIAPGPNCTLESIPGGDDYSDVNFCGPTAMANVLWWLDSKYSDPDGTPCDGEDNFLLVEDYGSGDDHAPDNAPCLICELANAMNATNKAATYQEDMIYGIDNWIADANLEHVLEFHFYEFPSFEFIAGEIEQGKAMTLALTFLKKIGDECVPLVGHLVACAAVNFDELKIALSDPFWDIQNPPGNPEEHNDPQNVSYDVFEVSIGSPCSNYPEIQCWLPSYPYWEVTVVYGVGVFNTTNEPPDIPSISGKTNGKAGKEYEYTFYTVDPDADDIKYFIDWGDNEQESTAFNTSGTDVKVKHTWDNEGTYNITAKAQDTNGFYSLKGKFEVTIPRNKALFNIQPILLWLIKQFSMLRRVLGL